MTPQQNTEQTIETSSGSDVSWCRDVREADVRRSDVITGEVSHKREKSDESMNYVEHETSIHPRRFVSFLLFAINWAVYSYIFFNVLDTDYGFFTISPVAMQI